MARSLVRRTARPARDSGLASASGGGGRAFHCVTLASRIRRRSVALGLAAVAGLLAPSRAAAHARLVRSQPPEAARLATAPVTIDLWFNELLDDAFNTVTIYPAADAGADSASPAERNLAAGPPEVDASDRTHLSCPLGTLAPGAYVAEWQVLSRDGHTARGRLRFRVEHPD